MPAEFLMVVWTGVEVFSISDEVVYPLDAWLGLSALLTRGGPLGAVAALVAPAGLLFWASGRLGGRTYRKRRPPRRRTQGPLGRRRAVRTAPG